MSYDATLDEMAPVFLAADPVTHQTDFQKPVHKLGAPVRNNVNHVQGIGFSKKISGLIDPAFVTGIYAFSSPNITVPLISEN